MKLKILDTKNAEKGSIDLPQAFSEPVRPDMIKRAVETVQANRRQPYGAYRYAGMETSAKISRRRRDYRGAYGQGISRVPRKIMSRRGTRMNWVAAFAPGTVGGRPAHPPKPSKDWSKKINIKERRKAIRSALAATMLKEYVKARGHAPPQAYPFIISDDFETLEKTKDVENALEALGFKEELERASQRTYKAGKARLRGRKYRKRKGPLFVVSKECRLMHAADNIPGIDIATINNINAELLAPGSVPGRLTLFTKAAIERLGKENLFYEKKGGEAKPEKKKTPAKTAKKE